MYIVMAILGFSLLIIGHEFGHFILARINDVKVLEFSLGMGPKIYGIKGKETEYSIKALPIGGYVRMLGEEEKVNDERSFSQKKPFQRLSIIAAGPIMNFIMAILLFSIIAYVTGFATTTIDKVIEGKPALAAGLQSGDKIIKVNDTKINTWDEFSIQVSKGESFNLVVLRGGVEKNFNVTPVKDAEENRFIIGISSMTERNPNVLKCIKQGLIETNTMIKATFSFFQNLFRGKVSGSDVGGPITIIKISTEAAKTGAINLLYIVALLSVQLAIFNLIPFPALDGGWIFLLLFEIITGKKADDEKVGMVNYIGFILLMALMVLVTIKDILYPINLH